MSLENKDTIESLKNKISFWEKSLTRTRNMQERAVLDSKIKDAKHRINELKKSDMNQKIESLVDAPSVADRDSESTIHLSRGQIMNSGNVFSITI